MSLSTHLLDLASGRPAAGVAVQLERRTSGGTWEHVAAHVTDADGRVQELLAGESLGALRYRLTFATGAYHEGHGITPFFPEVSIVFEVRECTQHHHVPLLLSPFGYSTYRGS